MAQSDELRSKLSLFFHCLLINLGALTSGVFFAGFNACFYEIINIKDSNPEKEDVFIASLSSAIPIGGIFGGLIACLLSIKLGRRSLMMAADIIAIFGCIMSPSLQFSTMLTGRTICGFVCGMNFMLIPLYMRELLPYYMAPRTTVFFRGMFAFGVLLAFLLGLISEGPNDPDKTWAIVFLVPLVFALIRLLGLAFWIKMDTAAFYLKQDKKEKALEALKKLYKDQYWDEAYIKELNMSVSFQFREAFAQENRRQVGVTIVLVLFTQLMGGSVLNFFSTQIFMREEETLFNAKVLNVFVAIIAWLAVFPGFVLTRKLGRRRLLICGAILLCIICLLIAFSELVAFVIAHRGLIVLFALIQNLTFNIASSVSAYEILPSYSLVFQVITEMGGILLTTLLFSFIAIRISFIVFAALSGAGFIVMFKLIKETKWISLFQSCSEYQSLNQGFLTEEKNFNEESRFGVKRTGMEKQLSRRDDATADPISLY